MKSRWEWIFSGTSIKEAKTTVEQGNNIRLLTLVTLFYLPLSYVSSIYGSKPLRSASPMSVFIRQTLILT